MKKIYILKTFLFFMMVNVYGQDTSYVKYSNQRDSAKVFFKSSIVPFFLIGYGTSTIQNWGIYSSYDFQRDVRNIFPVIHTNIDSYLRFAPILALGGLKLTNIPSRSDRINTGIIFIKSQVLMTGIVYALKYSVNLTRPDGMPYSFPSGHAAQAFMGAALIHKEYKKFSYWPGVIAYIFATSTSVLRVLKDEHWKSDVLTGAGIGILSVNLIYLTHKYKWKEPKVLRF